MSSIRIITLSILTPMLIYIFFALKRFFGIFGFFKNHKLLTIGVCIAICMFLLYEGRSIYNLGLIFVLYLFFALLLIQIVHIFWKNQIFYNLAIPIAVVIVGIIFSFGYANMHNIVKTAYEIEDTGCDMKIAFISDLHLGINMDADEFNEYLLQAQEDGAEVLLLGGDIFDESTTRANMEKTCEYLSQTSFKYGVFYVYGNHDMNWYRSDCEYTEGEMTAALKAAGVQILANDYKALDNGVTIIGMKDYSMEDRAELAEIIRKAVAAAPDNYIIMMDHQPVSLKDKAELGVDLNLSGHTHAGQIWPLGWIEGFIGTNEQVYGLETYDDMTSITSSGIAGWGYTIRTQSHCEWEFITLK